MRHDLHQIQAREIIPGFWAKFIHTEAATIGFIDIKSGSKLPEHQHIHVQTTTVLEGRLELFIEGESQVLEAGQAITIPSNIRHAALAHTDCKAIDVFSPVREDYKF